MGRRLRSSLHILAAIGLGVLFQSSPVIAQQEPVSLCVDVEDSCHVIGGRVDVTVQAGKSSSVIAGSQFSLSYNPDALRLMSIRPGDRCTSASPFSLVFAQTVDEQNGLIFYGVAIFPGNEGVLGPVTLACLSFMVVEPLTNNEICLLEDQFPTTVVDIDGNPMLIDNELDCPTERAFPVLSCNDVEVSDTCQCPQSEPDCTLWDDSCNVGVCDEVSARCEANVTNEGGICNDGDTCTLIDTCESGACRGSGCPNPSLCVTAEDTCAALGEIRVRVELGAGESNITGGQFSLRYDPIAFKFVGISPGQTCDSNSPFAMEIFRNIDESVGEISYATGVLPIFNGDDPLLTPTTQGPATLACLRFSTISAPQSEICLFNGDQFDSILVDDFGQAVAIDNSEDCFANLQPPDLACASIIVEEECQCTANPSICSVLDTECKMGICNELTGECETTPVNEGGLCDDADPCTTLDVCTLGDCVGSGCSNPSLCVEMEDFCSFGSDLRRVQIRLGEGSTIVSGGQFTLQYDSTALRFLGISPGSLCDSTSPFSFEVFRTVNELSGEIFFAFGVEPGEEGTKGSATVACLTFRLREFSETELCLINNLNPFSTILVTNTGQPLTVFNDLDCPTDLSFPILSCDGFCGSPPN